MALAGTTWTINSNVDMYLACNGILKNGVGSFVSKGVTYTSTSGNSGKTTDTAYYGSTLIWDSDTGWYDEAYRTIEIISVVSAYQSDLETWLNANAVEVVPVVPVDYLTTDVEITSIADAIRTKGGTSASLVYPTGFVTAIGNIQGAYPSADGVSFGTVASTITFTVDAYTYVAEENMTWAQWVASAYNTDGKISIVSNEVRYNYPVWNVLYNREAISGNTAIIPNYTYSVGTPR